MFQTKVLEKIKTFFKENRAVYDVMLKYIIKRAGPSVTMWRMRIVCWIPKATSTHSGYEILIAFLLQQLLQERASTLIRTTLPVYLDLPSCALFGECGLSATRLARHSFSMKRKVSQNRALVVMGIL